MGMNKKAKKKTKQKNDRRRSAFRQKITLQRNPITRGIAVKPTFVNKPLSNHDLVSWIKYLKIKNFNGVFSRDQIQDQNKKGYHIINMDDRQGPGTHWVVMNIQTNIIEYFDSFGLNCPMEVVYLSNNLRLNYIYNSTQYQNLFSVLCGYYCISYIHESHKGKQYYDIIEPFSHTNTNYNKQLITNYFQNI